MFKVRNKSNKKQEKQNLKKYENLTIYCFFFPFCFELRSECPIFTLFF